MGMNRHFVAGMGACVVVLLSQCASSAFADSGANLSLSEAQGAGDRGNPGAIFDGSAQAAPLADFAVDAGDDIFVRARLDRPVQAVSRKSQKIGWDGPVSYMGIATHEGCEGFLGCLGSTVATTLIAPLAGPIVGAHRGSKAMPIIGDAVGLVLGAVIGIAIAAVALVAGLVKTASEGIDFLRRSV